MKRRGRVAQSVQRLATGWTVRGSNPGGGGGQDFLHLSQTGPGAHPAFCTMGTGSFLGVKSGRGVTLTPYSFQCRGHKRVELYLYSHYGPYGLYRVSVPVQGCTLPYQLTVGCNVPLCQKFHSRWLLLLAKTCPRNNNIYIIQHIGNQLEVKRVLVQIY